MVEQPPKGVGFGAALQGSYPLLMAMSQGLMSGQGAFANMDAGLAGMMGLQERRQEAEEKRKAEEAQRMEIQNLGGTLSGLMGGTPGMASAQGASNGPMERNDAMDTFGGPSRAAAGALGVDFANTEQQYGLPQGYLTRTAQIESSMNPRARNPNSSASGLFQFIDGTARQYGLSDPMDPRASTDAAARLARDNAATLRRALGRDPTAAELYLAHQQGGGGAARLLANPNARAVDIVGADAVRLNGGNANMTAGEFASKWTSKFGQGQGGQQAPVMSAQGQPGGATGQAPRPQIAPQRLAKILMSPNIPDGVKSTVMERAFPNQGAVDWQRFQGPDGGIYAFNPRNRSVVPIMRGPGGPSGADRYMNVGGVLYDITGDTPQPVTQPQAGPSAREEQIARLVETGLDRNSAIGIADGRIAVSRDPDTGEAVLVDKGSLPLGQQGGNPTAPDQVQTERAPQPSVEPSDRFDGANVRGALGAQGLGAQALNSITDAIGMGQAAPGIGQASSALSDLSTRTMLGLSAEFPGRPSNLTRERIEALTVKPGEIATGPDRARQKAKNLLDLVSQSYEAAQSVASGEGGFSAQQRNQARETLNFLEPLLSDYMALNDALGPGGQGDLEVPSSFAEGLGELPEGITPESVWGEMTPEDRKLWQN